MSGNDDQFCGYQDVRNSSIPGLVLFLFLPESLLFVLLLLLVELVRSFFLFSPSNSGFLLFSLSSSALFPLVCAVDGLERSDG